MKTQEIDRALENAKAWMQSIGEMVEKLERATCPSTNGSDLDEWEDGGRERYHEAAREEIRESALSVDVRSGWDAPGATLKPAQYGILLSTGGPACRIVGDLDLSCEPVTALLQHQDWGTPWTECGVGMQGKDALLAFAQQFYFGE